jgi:extracellular matrix regulatory protein B
MFIHIGGDIVVRSAEVVAIIDHNMTASKWMRKFLENKEERHQLISVSKEDTKSFVITKDKIYCSPISSLTLKRRANFVSSLESR